MAAWTHMSQLMRLWHLWLRKFNLQTRMRSSPLGLHVWFLVRPFVYFQTVQRAGHICDKYHNLMSWLK